jgi:hypothetical protein
MAQSMKIALKNVVSLASVFRSRFGILFPSSVWSSCVFQYSFGSKNGFHNFLLYFKRLLGTWYS